MHGRLNRSPADACESGDLVYRKVADAVALDLAGNDAQHRPLAFGVVVPEIAGQDARPAEHPASVP